MDVILGIWLTQSWVNGSRDPRDPPRFVDPFDLWPMTHCQLWFHHSLMGSSVSHVPHFHRILWKSVELFERNPANKQTNKQRGNITCLAEVTTSIPGLHGHTYDRQSEADRRPVKSTLLNSEDVDYNFITAHAPSPATGYLRGGYKFFTT